MFMLCADSNLKSESKCVSIIVYKFQLVFIRDGIFLFFYKGLDSEVDKCDMT